MFIYNFSLGISSIQHTEPAYLQNIAKIQILSI